MSAITDAGSCIVIWHYYRAYPQIVRTAPATLGHFTGKARGQPFYSHFELIVAIDDDLKRTFYEIERMRGNWSVRELKRHIVSLYYVRYGLSKDKQDVLSEGDNPPIGILLCAQRDHTLVEYALAGADNSFFMFNTSLSF